VPFTIDLNALNKLSSQAEGVTAQAEVKQLLEESPASTCCCETFWFKLWQLV
jgi:hypothetical protein